MEEQAHGLHSFHGQDLSVGLEELACAWPGSLMSAQPRP
jgi:hypothetical protein